jgi:hypothetical protein
MDIFSIELSFNKVLKLLEYLKKFRFMFEEIDPSVSTEVIDTTHIKSMIANRGRDRPPNIRMYQIKGSTTFIARARRRELMTLFSLERFAHRLNIMTNRVWKQIVSIDSLNNRK